MERVPFARHVLHNAKNKAIRVLPGPEWLLYDHMREAHREGLKYGLRHIAFNPDEAMTDEQLSTFASRLCEELHADPEHLTLVVHQKNGSTHGHLILPEWQQDHVLESRFTWMRMEKVARLKKSDLGTNWSLVGMTGLLPKPCARKAITMQRNRSMLSYLFLMMQNPVQPTRRKRDVSPNAKGLIFQP